LIQKRIRGAKRISEQLLQVLPIRSISK
jgi:integrase/recombinase XerD